MKLGNVFDALGDDTRREILRVLADGEKSAGDIAAQFNLSKPTLSHHFRVLRAERLPPVWMKRATSVRTSEQLTLLNVQDRSSIS